MGSLIVYLANRLDEGPHLDVFQDRRHGFVCKAPDITDAVMPRSAIAANLFDTSNTSRSCSEDMAKGVIAKTTDDPAASRVLIDILPSHVDSPSSGGRPLGTHIMFERWFGK